MDRKELTRLVRGFQPARVILTANNFRVFELLKTKKTAAEVASALRTDQRATAILLDALTSLGLLRKARGAYTNAPVANEYLVSGKPGYQGDIIRHEDNLWDNWSGLDEVMTTGLPSRRRFEHGHFIKGMQNISVFKTKEVMEALDLAGVKTALDLGGGPGIYAVALAKRGLDVTLFDRPETMRIARQNARQAGVKVKLRKGDFMADPLGKGFDLVFISQIFHAFADEENREIVQRCRAALNPGGRMAVQEFPVSDDRTSPPEGALFAVNMLVNTHGGRTYPAKEIMGWLRESGFVKLSQKRLSDSVLIQGSLKT
jgi:ubiquinone/menaquinone biosynthesis C-methylase UbiE